MRIHLLMLWVLFSLLSLTEDARSQVFVHTEGYVEFISTAPMLEFKGVSNHLAGMIDVETGEVDFYIDLATLDTDNRRRDRDMRQVYLETDRYPFAEFSGNLKSAIDLNESGEQQVQVVGIFTMRGIEKEMTIPGLVEVKESGIRVQAQWEIRLEDFNIDRPRIVFYELSEVQTINIDIILFPYEEE
ncbi:YceI family protein [Balneolaceae bacterium ANBcel3]|nr:YceI family protein [Balneolaceae bacterium ANBcel3]